MKLIYSISIALLILFVPVVSIQAQKKLPSGLLLIKNETRSPKVFSIENVTPAKNKLKFRVTLKKDKTYNLDVGTYQINYFNFTKAERHSAYFRVKKNDTVRVVFYKTGKSKYDADFRVD